MSNIRRYTAGRTLFLAVFAVIALIGTASAKTICNSCKGTGKVLEVTKQCPLHQPLLGRCANCDGSGLVGPRCPYCEGLGYILTPAEKEALRKERAEADARAQAEGRELAAKRAEEKRVADSIKAVERVRNAANNAERTKGARRPGNIQSNVLMNMASLRYAYNQRLRDKPNLAGTVEVKFTINEFGSILSAQVVSSTLSDPELESMIIERIKGWKFDKIDVPGDVTTVTYPFVFNT